MNQRRWISILCCLMASVASGSELCKWTDAEGAIRFAEECPESLPGEMIKLEEGPQAKSSEGHRPREYLSKMERKAQESMTSILISDESQLLGCWKLLRPPKGANPDYNTFKLYPSEEPPFQYFCFGGGGRLHTMMTDRKPNASPQELKREIMALASGERYQVVREGFVWIQHLDTGAEFIWDSMLFRVKGSEELHGWREGDLYMRLRNTKTGEDVYKRHLRRLE